MYHQRQKSSSSARSDLSRRSFLSASPFQSPRPTPSIPSPSVCRNSLSPAHTPHKRNRYKTLFFTPSIRDSGISLNAPTSDPRLPSPLTPPCFPVPRVPIQEEPYNQNELDFLVDELAIQFGYQESSSMVYPTPDRCDSPTLGSFPAGLGHPSTSMPPKPTSVWPRKRQNKTRGPTSPLPGASHLNSPVDLSMRELATSSRSNKTKKLNSSPKPVINPSSPLLGLPQVFRRLALTDPHINGQPIRFLSHDYVAGANSLIVGSCTFMNLPYGADVECGLRVEPSFPRSASKAQVVILQIVQRVVRVRDGSSVWLLCSEVDVSASFTPEVRAELSSITSASSSQLSSITSASSSQPSDKGKGKQRHTDDDIWLSLAQQLDTDSYAPSTTRLPTTSANSKDTKTTTPALSDLLSLLTELRFLHRQFFILQPKISKSSGHTTLAIPYLSSSLHTSLLSLPTSNHNPTSATNINGFDTSIYTPNTTEPNPLSIFITTAIAQAKTWLPSAESNTEMTTIRQILNLPKIGKGKDLHEKIG
ncbi:hypothetical protein D6D06_09327, partial [Aureobasidium pullulans]